MAAPTTIVSHIPPPIRRSRRRHALTLALRIAAAVCLTVLALQIGWALWLAVSEPKGAADVMRAAGLQEPQS